MKRFRLICGGVAYASAALLAVLAQPEIDQPEKPAAAAEWKPASVVTPTSDAEAEAAGQPLAPQVPGEPTEPEVAAPAEEPVAPAPEAVAADRAVAAAGRKLWRIRPLFAAGVLYDDNIFLGNTNRVADVIWTISFGLAFELGDFRGGAENYLRAQWVGFPTFYTDNPSENSFNQAASLLAQYRWTRLVGQFESAFRIAREGNREVNTITTTRTFSNSLRFQYDYSPKTSFDLLFLQNYSQSSDPAEPTAEIAASGQTTNNQYEARAGMNYQILPKTNLGLEVAGGVLDQSSSPLQYYQQARLRVSYAATGKLNFRFSGGVEAREFEGSDLIRISPVFSLGLDYHPFDGTSLSMVGYRNVQAATSITGQDVTATGFEIALVQRILQRFTAGIGFGYENDVYFGTTGEEISGDTDRVDNFLFVRPRLTYSFVDWFSASVFYEYRRAISTQSDSSFYNNRVGMEIATKF
jgi:Putative beta-barrel porin 2